MICAMLYFVIWISGVLHDNVCFWPLWFSKPTIHPQWSCSLRYMHASVYWSHAFGRCCILPKSLLVTFLVFPFCSLFQKNSVNVLRKLFILNHCKFLVRASSPLLNDTLHLQYIVTALKIIIYDNIACFGFSNI